MARLCRGKALIVNRKNLTPLTTTIVITLLGVSATLFAFTSVAQKTPDNRDRVYHDRIYTVKSGDTLWNIAEQFLENVKLVESLRQFNKIDEPAQLAPGTQLRFRDEWLKRIPQPSPVDVTRVTGEAKARLAATGNVIDLSAGAQLQTGDILFTEASTSVVLTFADGSTMIVRDHSEVIFDVISIHPTSSMVDTRLRLQRGSLINRVKPLQDNDSRFEITTPAATLGVRGTDFRVRADAEQNLLHSEVLDGAVEVSGGGQAQLVPKLFGTVAKPTRPPLAPVALLPRPDLAPSLSALTQRPPLTFSWQPLTGATRYRLRIASDAAFYQLISNRVLEQATVSDIDLPPGRYFVAVRGIDELGLEGSDARLDLTIQVR